MTGFGLSRIYAVQGTVSLTVAAAVGLVPGVSPPIKFQFPRPIFITGILGLPRESVGGALSFDAMMGALSMAVTDQSQNALVSDGRGTQGPTIGDGLLTQSMPFQAVGGHAFRPFPLQRPIGGCDIWTFTVQNTAAFPITLAGIYVYAESQ